MSKEWYEFEFDKRFVSVDEKNHLVRRVGVLESKVNELSDYIEGSFKYLNNVVVDLCNHIDANSNAIDQMWLNQGKMIVEVDEEDTEEPEDDEEEDDDWGSNYR